jgi:predicted metal-binding protein
VPRTWITVCETCKREGWDPVLTETTDGERLAALVESAAAHAYPALAVRRNACLMGCTRACNVAVQGAGKLAYTLGMFEPTPAAAGAICAWAALHAESDMGIVPYRQWPEGVKGHFVTRHLPLPQE